MSYLFSDSRLPSSTTPPPSINPVTARAHITASLLSMGFPLSRVHPLVSLLNPSQPNAIEVALELLTRDSDGDDDPDDPDPLDDPLHLSGLRHRHRPPPPDDDDPSDSLAILRVMTGCTADEAALALQREPDINAAAEFILQRQEHKDSSPTPLTPAEALDDEHRRQQRHTQRLQRRRERVAEYRRVEEAGEGRRFLHYGDALLVQHVQSEEMLSVDSDSNAVTLQPYTSTPAFSSPSTSSRHSNAITSPLTLPKSHSYGTPKGSALPASILPPSLSLSSSGSPPSAASRSLLSSSPPVRRTLMAGAVGSSSAFFPSTSLHSGPLTIPAPLHPLSPASTHSGDRSTFPSLSLSPLRSPSKPRSFSTPRKSSHPLSLSLPSHHRYHLVIRRAPQSPSFASTPAAAEEAVEGDGEEEEAGLVMSGDRIVLETYERCYLCVEADGSIGCNRTAPLTQQMQFTVRLEEKVDAESGSQAAGEEEEDIRAMDVNAVVSLCTVDHHYLGVESQHAVAKHSLASLSQHFLLSLAHKGATPHRRHRSSAASLPLPSSVSPAVTATAAGAPPSTASLHWAYLRANFRLLAMSELQTAIAEKRVLLLQKQRAARLHREDAKRLCSICLDRVCEVVLLECGHSCACEECAQGLKECIVCRQKVHKVVVIRAA